MTKIKQIDYRKELELVTRTDEVAELINKTIVRLSYRNARSFLSGVEKAVKKDSTHWKKIEGLNDKAYVLNGLRERVPRIHLKPGELVSVKDIADLLNYNPISTFNALSRLEDELDINLIRSPYYNNPRYVYVLKPASEESYPKRIPIIGKPKLYSEPRQNNDRLLTLNGSITKEQATKLGIEGPTHGDFYNEFGSNPRVIKECFKQLSARVKGRGYCWKNEGDIHGSIYYRNTPYITPEEANNIFRLFLEKTGLPVGTIDDKPVLAYHPKLIRKYRKK